MVTVNTPQAVPLTLQMPSNTRNHSQPRYIRLRKAVNMNMTSLHSENHPIMKYSMSEKQALRRERLEHK